MKSTKKTESSKSSYPALIGYGKSNRQAGKNRQGDAHDRPCSHSQKQQEIRHRNQRKGRRRRRQRGRNGRGLRGISGVWHFEPKKDLFQVVFAEKPPLFGENPIRLFRVRLGKNSTRIFFRYPAGRVGTLCEKGAFLRKPFLR